jgi:hypothetical protein
LAGATAEALGDLSGEDALPLMKAEPATPDPEGEDSQETAPGGDQMDTAEGEPMPDEPTDQDPKTLFWDPFAIIEQLGYKERPSAVTYGTLKAMAWRTPILQAIIQTRIQQMAAFSQVSRDRYDLGFKIRTREATHEPTPAEAKWIKQAETMMLRTGITDNPRGRDSFEKFLRKFMWDSLVYDQACMEVVPDRMGRPTEFYAVDASTFRLADTASTYLNEDEKTAVRYVQIYDGMIISEYNQEELCFGVRNPRTDIRLFGYGVSELEMLMVVITAILFGWDYNQKAFSQGSSQKGVLNFKGAIPERQLKAFRRHWYQMISGVENAWRTPITNAEDLQWVAMQNSNRDMEYNAWFDFLIKIACAMFTIDPVEINFKYGNTGQKSGMTEANNKEKIVESKERGLRPLLRFAEACINQWVIWPINENFEFKFMGMDARTREETADLNTKLVKTVRTIDELRAEDDLPPLPDGKGECILDPTWLQFASAKDQAAQGGMPGMAPGSQMGGQPGAEGEAEPVDFQQLLTQYGGQEQEQPVAKSMTPAGGGKFRLNLTL